MNIIVIDYGLGNHRSVLNALQYLGCNAAVSGKADDILNADGLVLPGVGAFAVGMQNIRERGLDQIMKKAVVREGKPILGICLGMQLMATDSMEKGHHDGLNWIPGTVRLFDRAYVDQIPHVGWNNLDIEKKEPLFVNLLREAVFYFDHSYHFVCRSSDNIAAVCGYKKALFTAAVQKDNIFGVQFHPEKSQNAGLKLFRNFLNYIAEMKIHA